MPADALLNDVLATLPAIYSDAEVRGQRGILIVETRAHSQLPHLLRQCRRILPAWKILLIHGPDALSTIRDDEHLLRDIRGGKIDCRRLRLRTANIEQYNVLMTSHVFYSRLPFAHFLVAQTDSVLCAGALASLTDFLDYDYVGAPWKPHPLTGKTREGGNGGFSLRRRQAMIDFCRAVPRAGKEPEDVYFCKRGGALELRLPPRDVAMRFSVESVPAAAPVGTHKPWEHLNAAQLRDLACDCPGLKTMLENNGPRAAAAAAAFDEVLAGAGAVAEEKEEEKREEAREACGVVSSFHRSFIESQAAKASAALSSRRTLPNYSTAARACRVPLIED